MKNEEYKKLSISEFTKAAGRYESNHAGIYEMCKKDYPDILAELEKETFRELLDAGCGPAPMISLLAEKYPDRHYTGIDLTPKMIEQARKRISPIRNLSLEIVKIFRFRKTVSTRLSVPTAFITIRTRRTFLTAYRKS